MEFQVLSHAGLRVTSCSAELLCDPWLIGSSYWRSWWNYPPVSGEIISRLKPDFIYLTHIHWDHFHGPSLRIFPKSTQIIIPEGNYDRIHRDLSQMGFTNIIELRHGKRHVLGEDFAITSYQFGVFLDSALVVECDGVTLLNANDAKLMGLPLDQVLRRHPKIDFVFRSHSSANSRLCYEIIDSPKHAVDDMDRYIKSFVQFVQRCNATYAIPFASNHCFLHRDVFRYNNTVQTPKMVQEYFARENIDFPKLKVMLSGDTWSSASGFEIADNDYFSSREQNLTKYQEQMRDKLDKTYAREDKAVVTLQQIEAYFNKFSAAIPYLIRRRFKDHPIVYRLTAGNEAKIFEVNVFYGSVRELPELDDTLNPIQIHTSTAIFKRCIQVDLFSHLAISKRVKYRASMAGRKFIVLLNLLFNFYEYDMLPVRRIMRVRFFRTWALRWREIILYAQMTMDYALRRRLEIDKYLVPVKTH